MTAQQAAFSLAQNFKDARAGFLRDAKKQSAAGLRVGEKDAMRFAGVAFQLNVLSAVSRFCAVPPGADSCSMSAKNFVGSIAGNRVGRNLRADVARATHRGEMTKQAETGDVDAARTRPRSARSAPTNSPAT